MVPNRRTRGGLSTRASVNPLDIGANIGLSLNISHDRIIIADLRQDGNVA